MRIENHHEALASFPDIDGFWLVDDLPETERRIVEKQPLAGEGAEAIELLTQLARVQGLLGRVAEAQASLDQARKMISEATIKIPVRTEVRWLLEQGRILSLSMSLAKAQDFFVRAWTLASEEGLIFFVIDAALMLSVIRPPKEKNEWLQKALKAASDTQDEKVRLWMVQLLFIEGWHAFDVRQFDKALETFDRALLEPRAPSSESFATSLQWARARVFRALGKVPEALSIQEELLVKMQQQNKVSGHVYLEIAECKQLLKAKDEAKANFELAHAALSNEDWYADNRSSELDRMKYLAKNR